MLKPRRLEPMFKMADGAGEMCRRNLGFQPSKKTTKGQFLIFFLERYYCIRIHWRRYVISHDNRAESNFHSRRGRRVVVNHLSCLYFERSKRAYYVRTFFSLRVRNVYPRTLNFAGKLERFWNWWTDVIWIRTKKFNSNSCSLLLNLLWRFVWVRDGRFIPGTQKWKWDDFKKVS